MTNPNFLPQNPTDPTLPDRLRYMGEIQRHSSDALSNGAGMSLAPYWFVGGHNTIRNLRWWNQVESPSWRKPARLGLVLPLDAGENGAIEVAFSRPRLNGSPVGEADFEGSRVRANRFRVEGIQDGERLQVLDMGAAVIDFSGVGTKLGADEADRSRWQNVMSIDNLALISGAIQANPVEPS